MTTLAVTVSVTAGAACGDSDLSTANVAGTGQAAESERLRLGYFANLTHAPAIVGVDEGLFADALGSGTKLEATTFSAGPAAVEALFVGAVDATYIGPNPAINAYAKSNGEGLRVIAGSTSGGAFLVVREGIDTPQDLRGAKIATPQLGNTQDVAIRHWLEEQGLSSTLEGGGEVSILPQENATAAQAFAAGQIDGAWVPEPWATRLQLESGGTVLVDESELWPDGRFVTTHLVVRTEFLQEYPGTVRKLLDGHLAAIGAVNDDAEAAKERLNAGLEALSGKPLADPVLDAAWENLEFTADPIASSLFGSAEHAQAVGLLEPVDLDGIYDLSLLNAALEAAGEPTVAQP